MVVSAAAPRSAQPAFVFSMLRSRLNGRFVTEKSQRVVSCCIVTRTVLITQLALRC